MASACAGQCPDSINAALNCRRKNVDRDYGGTSGGAWASCHGDRSGRKLLAVGHYSESTVDGRGNRLAVFAASRDPADHMIPMAASVLAGGAERGELCAKRNGLTLAAVLAARLRADCFCEIWTDVDGVWLRDPPVPDAAAEIDVP